ncbi:MAG: hypothetical protein AVDCRST_MAG22-12 [uncultured Rubrobacteraceae bacterium]|uniref:Uncharacterized protein n=1 Tax=uncultured Rubrobacteraceae bacterium TaxID=349277 RepID=A0A6J4NE51_9ACTN|nr:MAG: hypothetical protein AVDCRST_MAG22-12 [uncultured Rubrobacteraceae bacterium]
MRARSPLMRTLVYAALVILAFALSVGVGAMGALMLQGDHTGLLERQEPRSADGQAVNQAQQSDAAEQKEAAAKRERAAAEQKEAAKQEQAAADRAEAAQRAEAEYVDAVEDIQTNAVETFRNSHEKLLRYDSLSAADVEGMKANEAALQGMADRAADLGPPQKYEEQHGVFGAAIQQLHEAARLAHAMAADPLAATETSFDEYDGRAGEASALLRRSNELLGEDHETIEGVREVSPEF